MKYSKPKRTAAKRKKKQPKKAKPAPRIFAFISDIHGNIDALTAVLADIEALGVKVIFCLGDIIGYGPEPAACVQRVMETCACTVFGNHETMLYLADQIPPSEFDPRIGKPIELAITQLTDPQIKWLKSLPIAAELDPLTLSHGSLCRPAEFSYLLSQEEALAHFQEQTTFASFNGHSHIPCIWEKRGDELYCFAPSETPVLLTPSSRYSINVGSVGQPRDNDPRASYAIYNIDTHALLHRRVPYDIAQAQTRFKKAALPRENARRIQTGD